MTFTRRVNGGEVEVITVEPGEEHGHVCGICGTGWMCSLDCDEDAEAEAICEDCLEDHE